MNNEEIVKQLQWCIDGICIEAQDTIWVYDPEYKNRPMTVVEALQEIKEEMEFRRTNAIVEEGK